MRVQGDISSLQIRSFALRYAAHAYDAKPLSCGCHSWVCRTRAALANDLVGCAGFICILSGPLSPCNEGAIDPRRMQCT